MNELTLWTCTEIPPERDSALPSHSISRGTVFEGKPKSPENGVLTWLIHELSTPLISIMGFSELLLNEKHYGKGSSEQQIEFLSSIHDKAKVINRIVGTLSDLSLIQSDRKIALDRMRTPVDHLFHEAMELFQHELGQNRFDVVVGEGPAEVWGDRKRLLSVLEHLIDNAVRFSPGQGSIRLIWTPSGDWVFISVEDEGIGMSLNQMEKIFVPFYRVDTSDTAPSGLGLGLPIAKAIVEGHGGRISVESQLGRGTKVTFAIPLHQRCERGQSWDKRSPCSGGNI